MHLTQRSVARPYSDGVVSSASTGDASLSRPASMRSLSQHQPFASQHQPVAIPQHQPVVFRTTTSCHSAAKRRNLLSLSPAIKVQLATNVSFPDIARNAAFAHASTNAPPQTKCHPERSAAKSKDLRFARPTTTPPAAMSSVRKKEISHEKRREEKTPRAAQSTQHRTYFAFACPQKI